MRRADRELRQAHAAAKIALLPPSPERVHLHMLRFVARTVRERRALGTVFATERAQFAALYAARKAETRRGLTTPEAEALLDASRAFWRVTRGVT